MTNLRQCLAIFSIVCAASSIAQPVEGTLNWYNQEGQGMFTEKAYKYLRKKESKTVIVGVIDSGVDIEHKDLEGKIWINTDEIADNGIDDDNNGYIDDIHGWNFLGNAEGAHVNEARLEKTRILAALAPKYDGIDPNSIEQDAEYQLYLKVKEEVETGRAQFEQYMEMLDKLPEDAQNYIKSQMNFNLNVDFDDRSLIGDDPDDFSDVNYGNADVEGPLLEFVQSKFPLHCT